MLSLMLIASAAAPSSAQDVFYDTLWITDDCYFNTAISNALSGRGMFGTLYDLRLADDFELERAAVIDSVVADYVTILGNVPADGVYVRVYADLDGRPSEPPIFEHLATSVESERLGYDCTWHELPWRRLTVRGLSVSVPAGTYWIGIQPADTTGYSDWYYQFGMKEDSPEHEVIRSSAHLRDGDLGEGYWGHQDWRSTEEHDYGKVTASMRIAGHWATVCDRIESLSAVCRNGRLRVEVESSLPQGKRLTIINGEQRRRMTIRKDGRGRVHFDGQLEDGEVAIEGCEEWTQPFDCPE